MSRLNDSADFSRITAYRADLFASGTAERSMKIVGRGRIVLWEGASLWAFDVPSVRNDQPTTRLHAHHAIQITLSAGGRFAIRTEDDRREGPTVMIASGVPHAFEPEGKIALIFVEPESRVGQALMRGMAGASVVNLHTTYPGNGTAGFVDIWSDPRPDTRAVTELGKSILKHIAGEALLPSMLDLRITRTLDWLMPRLTGRISLAEAARIACLSESRFSHLFAAEVGLPFRTYLLWRRLMLAVERIASGSSLTAAAYEAGFADSAHFSRTFHRMFGVPAASLQLT